MAKTINVFELSKLKNVDENKKYWTLILSTWRKTFNSKQYFFWYLGYRS